MSSVKYSDAIKLNKRKTIELECTGYTQLDKDTFIIKKDGYYYVTKTVPCDVILLNCDED